ncbi:MAG: EAL domain-containing protein [Pseudomonadota bacterium]
MIFRKKEFLLELNAEENAQMRQEQVKIMYKQALASVFALFFGAIIIVYIFSSTPLEKPILIWFVAVSITLIWRLWVLNSYYTHPESHDNATFEKRLVYAMYASALVWGSIAFFIFKSSSLSQQFFLIFLLTGIASVASGTLASLLKVAMIFLALLLVPLFIVLFFHGGFEFQMMGIFIVIYYFLIISAAKRININIKSAITSKILHEKATRELHISEEHFVTIFKEAPTGIFFYNNDLIVLDSNSEMLNILQISRERMVGLDLRNLPDPCLDEALTAYQRGEKGFYEGPYTTMINKLQLWITLKTSPIYDDNRRIVGGVAIVNDITERRIAQEKMQHQAYFDALTDIPNRLLLTDRIEQSLAQYRRHHNLLAVLFLDLDHFKSVNDSLGHHIGDILLIETAKRLVSVCREGDTVARLGGDEFVILLNELGNDPHLAATKAEVVAEKIHEVLSKAFDVGLNEPIITSSSIGISLVGSNEHTADDLLKFADTAMYQAKKEGRSTTRFYQEQMDQWIKKQIFLENTLRNAIKNGELEVYYQPLVEVKSKNIVGAEALLRWNHSTLGLVMPDEMISIAEESGLIIPIGDWVLKEACTQFVSWKSNHPRGSELRRLAVNVSVIQFRQNDFVAKVMDIITKTGMDPSMLEIELTESVIIEKMDMIIEKMKQLKVFGIGMSMDDFGTGYSSLSSLKQLPISTLKIDRSFIRDIMIDGDDAALVETIIAMASIFKLDIIAEGVETMDQLLFLESFKCRYFQGYLCSKPIAVEEFEVLLETNFSTEFSK